MAMKALRRVAVSVTISTGVALALLLLWEAPVYLLFARTITLGLIATLVFSIVERWPRRLPANYERWIVQVVAVGFAMPIVLFFMHQQASGAGAKPFFEDHDWMLLGFSALLVAPWTAVATVVRQKEAFVRETQLRFALERSELERQALDARLHLLRAQIAPHFLFNTLANVQALVDAGSPRASEVLRSLTAYLRGAVPALDAPVTTIDRELQLVRPYLELMQMRMPDRLEFSVDADPAALQVRCPPATLLTLVENAVRHGIDPSEEGGRIDISIARAGARCIVQVTDTGAGLTREDTHWGSGLSTLRERLRLMFDDRATLRMLPNNARGTIAELDIPAES